MTFNLPELPYDFDALEPYIDSKTMEIHHGKHHATYVEKLNKALESHPEWQDKDIVDILKNLDKLPEVIRNTVRNNGGGHANHSLFWEIMGPGAKKEPEGKLCDDINSKFGSFNDFKEKFSELALNRFGSGWAWLVVNGNGEIGIIDTQNQDSPYMQGLTPILGLDVWEHAYYLKHQNRRKDYIETWWNVVNWDKVEENYQKALEVFNA